MLQTYSADLSAARPGPASLSEPGAAFPARYTDLVEVRKQHGSRADQVARYFSVGDPPADALVALFNKLPPGQGKKLFDLALEHGLAAVPQAPLPLRRLFQRVEEVPLWLDEKLLDLGCRTHLRCGIICGVVLGCCSLPLAYRSAAGNKPLMFTRYIMERAARRLSETNRFFLETCMPGSLRPHGPGWKTTVRVRVMHAQMRYLVRQSKQKPWPQDQWGVPINQVDLAATRLLFSVNLLRQLRQVGFHFTAVESEAVMHLWRYSGHLLGIRPELLCATETEGERLLDLLLDVTGTPDEDSIRLTKALMESALPLLITAAFPWLVRTGAALGKRPGWLARLGDHVLKLLRLRQQREEGLQQLVRFCYGLSHGLLGNRIAAELEFPRTLWRYTAPRLLHAVVAPLEICRRLIPGATGLAFRVGRNHLQRMMQSKLFAKYPSFRPPT